MRLRRETLLEFGDLGLQLSFSVPDFHVLFLV
jgi:hypothetical protein